MLGYYKLSREEIVSIIKKSEITKDGFYFCNYFPELNCALGTKKEKRYTFDRVYFENKMCFNNAELEIYLEEDTSYFNIQRMQSKDIFLNNIIKEYTTLDLNKKIPGEDFTLEDLIDTSIFFFENKY